jgi:dynein heavy chain
MTEHLCCRETGCYVLRGLDDTLQHLDDNIVMAQSLAFSPYKGPFEAEIEQLEKDLVMTQEVIDEWVACQRLWMYLEPIFGSEDIQKQLPAESKKFQAIDRNLRRFVDGAVKAPAVIDACTRGGQRTLDILRDGNKVLDAVQKGLTDYLETKRAGFARFYFLSNDELLEILSQTKEVTAVQPHLKKCFEGVNRLEFHVNGKEVSASAMYSVEGECVTWPQPLIIRGNVENWLTEVEDTMRSSLRHRLRECTDDYKLKDRTQWVLDHAAQNVLAAAQYYWSIEVEDALQTKGNAGLKDYFEGKMLPQLEGLVDLVRGKLSKLASITLGALITIEVHARDVIDNLISIGLSDTHDFEWISQLRYYWQDEEYVKRRAKQPIFVLKNNSGPRGEDMTVQQIQACFIYGYEYLGNTPRLVITPLTDRCYITLTSAMHICLGGAPQGPAGTGKTETTKDLAKALAKQCVVFNCSDGLDYLAMGKFFKGLASSGAWACFDEFNRIDVEVLSVVAQQVITIQLATKQNLSNFMFEGCDIALDVTQAVFITMNPGYAGRTELPDNLKALFRPMAMMVPDYRLIAEICLFSFGYSSAKFVSKRMTATFSLSSEQLSSQDHYDFGMRAVKSVINAAGILKRSQPDTNEDTLVYRALLDVNKPKFLVMLPSSLSICIQSNFSKETWFIALTV